MAAWLVSQARGSWNLDASRRGLILPRRVRPPCRAQRSIQSRQTGTYVPFPSPTRARFNEGMFVGDEVRLAVSFAAAQARLINLMHGNWLLNASRDAYDEGVVGLTRVGPLGATPGLSRLVDVQFRDLVHHGDAAVLTLRWQVSGSGTRLFPVLDADITLSPDGQDATVLALAGAYRPPFGVIGAQLDRAIFHRVATATIRSFVTRIADAIADPVQAPESVTGLADRQPSWLRPEPGAP